MLRGYSKAFELKEIPITGHSNTLIYVHCKNVAGSTSCYKKYQPGKKECHDQKKLRIRCITTNYGCWEVYLPMVAKEIK